MPLLTVVFGSFMVIVFGIFMITPINESVSVDLLSNHLKGKAYPWVVHWRGRRYTLTNVGLHHTVHEGSILIHIFTVTDGTVSFRLRLDTETLAWRLLEVDDGFGY